MMGNKGRLCLIIVLIADLAAAIVADARGTRVRRHSAEISSSSAPAAPLLDLLSRADPNQTSATAGAFPASLDLATAHTVGEPCLSTLENCEKWSVTVQGPDRPAGQRPDEFPRAVAVDSTTVFVGVSAVNFDTSDPYSSTASWTLAAYDLNTGAERWRVFRRSRVYDSLHGVAVSPDGGTVVATGGAYDAFPVGATDSRIVTVAYDSATGTERWSATWDNNPAGTDNSVIIAFSPDGRSVYVGGITAPTPGELDYVTIAYDATNGTEQWVSLYKGLGAGGTNSLSDLAVSPDGKRVYVTGESAGTREYELDYATVAYDASNGKELWVARSEPTFVDRAFCLAVDQDHVYVSGDSYTGPNGGDYQALTVALRANDGSLDWQTRLGGSGYNGARAITAGGGRVVVTTQSPSTGPDEGLTALTAAYDASSGNELWVTPLAEPLRSQLANDIALAPDGSHVYLIASSRPHVPDTALDDQEVIAYKVVDGSTAWSVHLDSGPANALTGDELAVTPDGSSVLTLGQVTYSANPLGSADQNIYDALVVALPTGFASTPVQLVDVVSKMTHGNAGAFDVDLTNGNGIECRSGGANDDYTLVFTFSNTLTNVDRARVTHGTGSVSNSYIDSDAHNYIVNLTGVSNAQSITITLNNVTDSAGNFSSAVSANMGVLVGDTNTDRFVDSADIAQTKSQSGNAVNGSNFREDVNGDGFIDSADIALVKSKSGAALP